MKSLKKNLVTLLILLIGATTLTGQNKALDLQDLVGAKGSSAEMDLQNRGYHHIKTSKSGNNIYSYWWNPSHKKCVSYRLSDGRILSIVNTLPYDCNKKTDNNGNNYNGNGGNRGSFEVSDLTNREEAYAYTKLNSHGFKQEKSYTDDGRLIKVWYKSKTHECIKTIAKHGTIVKIKTTSNQCSNTNYNSENQGNQTHVEVTDLTNRDEDFAYRKLNSRGFKQEKSYTDDGRLIKIWYHGRTHQCIKTIAKNGTVVKIKTTSDQCRNN